MQRPVLEPRIPDMHQARTLLRQALQEDLPAGLSIRVTNALIRIRTRQARLRYAASSLSGAVCLASFAGLFISLKSFLSAASASGFTAYASLMISDSSVVSGHLSSFLAGLVEVLPSAETTITLALVSVFLVSLRSAVSFGTRLPSFRTA